ncbi:MAG: protein-glutamate O-methyltransferase CheR [Desulfobacterales bacterium]|nr:protein-glutamate O-methyltransferase CheR [Desulfobacterales bacterium]
MSLSIDDYRKIRDFIYRKTGMYFEDRKLYFMQKRITQRIEAIGAQTPIDYLRELQFRDPHSKELQLFLNLMTTNETYFFREFEQLAVFGEHCLEEICKKKQELSSYRLRIWVAGCSTGEEAYTVAIILQEMLEDLDKWYITILANDINTTVLEYAKRGVYEKRSIKDVPLEYLGKWFTPLSDERYRIRSTIKDMVQFEQINFMDTSSMSHISNMDVIFCRNVLIYFDDDSRRQVVSNFYDALNPGGYIFLGHSESMARISSVFKVRRKAGFIVYQKPE